MQRIEDQLFAFVTAPVARDLFAATTDHDFIDVAFQQHLAMSTPEPTLEPAATDASMRSAHRSG